MARRLLTIPGIAAINSWGGPTKEFEVEVDPHKLEAYSVTVPQILTALGNANINVGGREIRIGQQSINIRGVGLIDDGGNDDLRQGYKVDDIENVVLAQSNGVPVLVRDVAKVSVGYRPRLGILGKDNDDDVVGSIVVMRRTEKTADMIPKVKEAIDKLNHDGSLPPGVKVVPYYDRSSLIALTTHTVLHNLIFGCILVFLIQWIFLGDLRSAIIVGLNIPFALFFATILLVMQGESANLLSVGAVDFGIIVDSAVILVENIFRNFQRDAEERQESAPAVWRRDTWGPDPTRSSEEPTPGSRMDGSIAADSDQRHAGGQGGSVLGAHHRGRIRALVHHAGSRGADLRPHGAHLRLRPGRSLDRHVHRHARDRFLPAPQKREGSRNHRRSPLAPYLQSCPAFLPGSPGSRGGNRLSCFSGDLRLHSDTRLGSEFLPHLEEGNFWIRASMPITLSLQDGEAATRKMRQILLRHPEVLTVVSQHGRPDDGSDASPFSNVELFAPLKPFDEWPKGLTKDKLTNQIQAEFNNELPGVVFNFSQYIEDNIEEGISGVKGVNSVKIVGPNLDDHHQPGATRCGTR